MRFTLPLPSDPRTVLDQALKPALALLKVTDRMGKPEGLVLTLAIGEQESKYLTRQQYGNGPAHGFWQNERGGGVKGVLSHPSSAALASRLCSLRGVEPTQNAVWQAMLEDDILAAGLARLLLWTDPKPLPALGDLEGSWATYQRVWRPGKPRSNEWAASYTKAMNAIRGDAA